MENVWIIVTSINPPTQAIVDFANMCKLNKWNFVVVGDTKTPLDWSCDNVTYLSLEQQYLLFPTIAKLIPTKHYCRKNIGYLYAISKGAEIIIDTDDDNLPYDSFAGDLSIEKNSELIGGSQWVNIYKYFSDDLIWPRGLALDFIHEKGQSLDSGTYRCLVQQGLADSDPDVDAIYRLLFKDPVKFNRTGKNFVIDKNCYVPFNSQNTIFSRDAFLLLYLPCFVSFRMTDIWRSFVAKRILDDMGEYLSFFDATVWQDRNAHNLMKDFRDEVVGYEHNTKIIETLESVRFTAEHTTKEKVLIAWQSLQNIGIVEDKELEIIQEWLKYF
jgi:hypothetical protein